MTRPQLDAQLQRHPQIGLSQVFYTGTRGGVHHLRHQHARGIQTLRIHRDDLPISPEMPLTRNPDHWVLLANRWWPDADTQPAFVLTPEAPADLRPDQGRAILTLPPETPVP